MQVIKRDGRISEFDEGRVIKAITLAMSNTPGGVDIDLATKIALRIHLIEKDNLKSAKQELTSCSEEVT